MTKDIKMLSCPICNNSRWTNCGNGVHQCDICETYFDKDENILMTEQEYIQTCTTEQLAKFLHDVQFSCNTCTLTSFRLYKSKTIKCPLQVSCAKENGVMEWLKQPHKESE